MILDAFSLECTRELLKVLKLASELVHDATRVSLFQICLSALLKKWDKIVAPHMPWIKYIHISPLNDYSNDCILHSNLINNNNLIYN